MVFNNNNKKKLFYQKSINLILLKFFQHERSNSTSEDSKGDTEFHKVHARMRARMDSK